MADRVELYAGYRGDQEPRAVWRGDERLVITAILRRWREPDGDHFVVRTEGGPVYEVHPVAGGFAATPRAPEPGGDG